MMKYSFLKYDKEKEQNISEIREVKKLPDKQYREIYQLISGEVTSLNEIYQKSSKSVGEINQILLMLELDGYIRKTAGGYECI